ncbi:hypothetical protein M9H77_13435 [Catharanthus roseus]|uniref:Uncharacterized protein n=1 Tax=Catharanthus roseus TaxID=4058 RepID=A0ACC0BKF5_CATRO|nr:hypothetical protein M9H77_13435 [Catharanthus roseus]
MQCYEKTFSFTILTIILLETTRGFKRSWKILRAPIRSALGQPQFRAPPDSPLGGRTLPQSMMRIPYRPIGPHPPRSMPLFQWIHSPESKTSMSLERALVRRTSHVQCNPLTRPNTRS